MWNKKCKKSNILIFLSYLPMTLSIPLCHVGGGGYMTTILGVLFSGLLYDFTMTLDECELGGSYRECVRMGKEGLFLASAVRNSIMLYLRANWQCKD